MALPFFWSSYKRLLCRYFYRPAGTDVMSAAFCRIIWFSQESVAKRHHKKLNIECRTLNVECRRALKRLEEKESEHFDMVHQDRP